MEERGA